MDRNNLSFFSARLYIEYSYKIDLRVGKDVYVQGIPKGYIDKNGRRQNYIHVLDINGLEVNKEPPLYRDGYWNGKKIPTEIEPIDDEEFLYMLDRYIKEKKTDKDEYTGFLNKKTVYRVNDYE